jgi:hypothetical protein
LLPPLTLQIFCHTITKRLPNESDPADWALRFTAIAARY